MTISSLPSNSLPEDASLLSADPRSLLMIKDSVAALLREEIASGRLQPGDRIVEGKWGKKLRVAQTSIREAINTLTAEGFVEKGSGKTASVTLLSPQNVAHIYQLRGVMEGLAARLVAERQADLSDLEQLLSDMKSAIECRNVRAFYQRDLRFHLLISEKSANPFLEQALRRVIVPLFAFVILRVHGNEEDPETWTRSLAQHRQMLEAMRSGDPFFAEQQVRNSIYKFFSITHELVECKPSADSTKSTVG
ncbi:MAG: GntR family transcriptional regulator [Bryobacteraceae bacterium]|jgi:DNA-binding GntR family transcriptional regulator